MAVCDCGAESSRTKLLASGKDGKPIPENQWKWVCPRCSPESFDRWVDPSNTHGGFRWQYEPWKYTKREMPDGSIFYEAKDERNADLEAQLSRGNVYEEKRKQAAVEEKRKTRRTQPLSQAEVELAINRARRKLQPESSIVTL